MEPIRIKKGLNIRLAGVPEPTIAEAISFPIVTVYPVEYEGVKPRLKVKSGDSVQRGTILFEDKKNESFKVRSPAGGNIREIVLGERRVIERIVIDIAKDEQVEEFPKYGIDQILGLSRDEVLSHLLSTGYLAFIRQRPFSKIADPTAAPKSIFVNGMATAPFQADLGTVIKGNEASFQAGLNALTRLTAGKVHLCLAPGSPIQAANVEVHTFAGPHPAGNTSVHIHHIDPIQPKDVVWTVKAVDLIQIGKLFLEGALPPSRVIAVGGPGVADGARKYYRVRIGGALKNLLDGKLVAGETRIIGGDALAGTAAGLDSFLRFRDSAITVLQVDRERHFLGWIMPGLNFFSRSRTFLSRWLKPNAEWALGTNTHGSPRTMVLTGLYDQVMPMNILVDYLVRAVLAHDTDEAVKLGLLEVDPEDFALCAFVCPSKMDVVAIIRQGLAEVEKEGI